MNAIQTDGKDISPEHFLHIPKRVMVMDQIGEYIIQVHFLPLSKHGTCVPARKHAVLPNATGTPLHAKLDKVNAVQLYYLKIKIRTPNSRHRTVIVLLVHLCLFKDRNSYTK